ncbi:MAG: TMEM165/GDT1 family protein [Nostocaceae cyanobacterium]|nr:TMEM165/GDT1 family protein [Nostocaceae cyanobacterium]
MKVDSQPLSLASVSQLESALELQDCPQSTSVTVQRSNSTAKTPGTQTSGWGIFASTFITIFLAELGDKTQLSTLLMSAESHSPWLVFLGAGVALVTTSFLGVALGSFIASRLSPKTVNKAAGVMLLFISVMLFCDLLQG